MSVVYQPLSKLDIDMYVHNNSIYASMLRFVHHNKTTQQDNSQKRLAEQTHKVLVWNDFLELDSQIRVQSGGSDKVLAYCLSS